MSAIALVLDGNLTAEPELRFTPSGIAVCGFTVACTERKYDTQSKAWVDASVVFMRCTAWRDSAETISAVAQKGSAVLVTGKLEESHWEDKDGNKRVTYQCRVTTLALKPRPLGPIGAGEVAEPEPEPEPEPVPAPRANPTRTRR